MIGIPWTDPRIWGAFVLGFGAQLVNGIGGLDFGGSSVTDATSSLVDLAQQAGWNADTGSGFMPFVTGGLAGPSAGALFSIQAPSFGDRGRTYGGQLRYTRFPLLPVDPVIPVAAAWGLGISPVRHMRRPPPRS